MNASTKTMLVKSGIPVNQRYLYIYSNNLPKVEKSNNPTKIARTRFIPRAGFAVSGIRYPAEPSAASSSIGTITTSTTPLSASGMSR